MTNNFYLFQFVKWLINHCDVIMDWGPIITFDNITKETKTIYFYDYDVTLEIPFQINYCYWFFSLIAPVEFVLPRTEHLCGRHSSVVLSVPTTAAPGSYPKHTIYAFFNLYYWNCIQKTTKINKKRPGLAHFFKKRTEHVFFKHN